MKHPLIVSLLASVCLPGFASAAWLRLPTIENEPVNLASSIFVGTQVQSSSGITNPSALLAGSSAGVAMVPAGASEAVISMGEQQLVDQVSFINDGVAGKLVVATSADQKQWTPIAQASFTATDREVPVKFAGAHAKYVRLAFDSATGAAIRNVRISGPAGVQSYKEVPVKEAKAVEVNLASATFGAHPIYVYPTPANFGELDAQQVFRFSKSTERYRTVVYDLGSVRTIKKFNAAYSRVATKVQVYAFEQLPEKKDWRGKMTLDSAAFDELKPIATVEDARGEGNVQIVPERPVETQYVVLRFEPNYDKQPAVAGLIPDWKAMAVAAAMPFAGVVKDFGRVDAGSTIAVTEGNGDDFVIYDAAAGGTLPLVLISRASISLVTQQLGPAATEENAINTILTAAGFAAISNATVVSNKTQTEVSDPSASSGATDTSGLDALGLSAYRANSGGGSGGRSPFGPSIGRTSLGLGTFNTGSTDATTPVAGASVESSTGTVTPTNAATPTPTGTTIPPTSP